MNTATTQSIGTTTVGAINAHGMGNLRGITAHDGIYTAFSKTFCRDFKTLNGAVAFMARMGYNADGTRP